MYKKLNDKAKEYITKELSQYFFIKFDSNELFERCETELDLLYEKNLLFIIEYLYKFKNESQKVKYHFRGTINNLLILYVLDLSCVNPLEYNLPYELFTDKTINVDLINDSDLALVSYLNKQTDEFKIVAGFFIKEDIKEINSILDERMLLRFNDLGLLQTIDDYRNYKNEYMAIRIDNKPYIKNKKVSLDNVFSNYFEKEIAKILKPKSVNDYIKVKSISHGTEAWHGNQEFLFKAKKININNLIATREDIFEYLLNHNIARNKALEITNFISLGKAQKDPIIWNQYIELMKEHNCEDIFIDIFSKILFLFGRGQAVSECLYVLDKNNYNMEKLKGLC